MRELWFCTQSEFEEVRRRRMNKVLYDKAKEYADSNTKGSKLELKCLAEMLYEFADSQIADIKANCDYVLEGKENEYREERSKLIDDFENMKAGLESQIATLGERCNQLLKDKGDFTDEVRMLKILVSSLVYEINQIWDINEMNDDLRMCAEKIDREVQLSKMAEDNRMVISALGFAIVPPKPKLDVKEI